MTNKSPYCFYYTSRQLNLRSIKEFSNLLLLSYLHFCLKEYIKKVSVFPLYFAVFLKVARVD